MSNSKLDANTLKSIFDCLPEYSVDIINGEIGGGTFGTTYKIEKINNKIPKNPLCAKVIYNVEIGKIKTEYNIMNIVYSKHPNLFVKPERLVLLKLKDNKESETSCGIIIMEMLEEVEITHNPIYFTRMLIDLAICVSAFMSLGIIHNDIKLENIGIKNGRFTIYDFGAALITKDETVNVSLPFSSYSVTYDSLNSEQSLRNDQCSLAYILRKFILGSEWPNFNPNSIKQLIERRKHLPPFDEPGYSATFKRMINRMSSFDRTKRYSVNELLKEIKTLATEINYTDCIDDVDNLLCIIGDLRKDYVIVVPTTQEPTHKPTPIHTPVPAQTSTVIYNSKVKGVNRDNRSNHNKTKTKNLYILALNGSAETRSYLNEMLNNCFDSIKNCINQDDYICLLVYNAHGYSKVVPPKKICDVKTTSPNISLSSGFTDVSVGLFSALTEEKKFHIQKGDKINTKVLIIGKGKITSSDNINKASFPINDMLTYCSQEGISIECIALGNNSVHNYKEKGFPDVTACENDSKFRRIIDNIINRKGVK